MDESRLPVIVGVGQYVNRSEDPADAREPVDMMAIVARRAEEDARTKGLLEKVDSVQVVNVLAWRYQDAPSLLVERLGVRPREKLYTTIGGNTPQWLANETADRIARGEVGLALIAGAEAIHSVRLARSRGVTLPWTSRFEGTPTMVGDARVGFHEIEVKHGAAQPIQVYPLYENALRAAGGWSVEDHRRRLGVLCERLSKVAEGNPYAWFRGARSAEEIATPGPGNRMVGFPYTKYMNAIIEVDQAAAFLMTSAARARELGIPRDRWVYLWGGADATETWFVSERAAYHYSPAIRWMTERALAAASISIEEISCFDLYSCFPSSVQLTRDALGLAEDDPRPLTVTGGLPYFGGPGNNYVSHAIATMVEHLREDPSRRGLVTGMGWYFTKHSAGVYGGEPPPHEWGAPRPVHGESWEAEGEARVPLAPEPAGTGTVEAYTIMHDRSGRPELGIFVGRLEDADARSGRRFIANAERDPQALRAMTEREMVGQRGRVSHDPESGLNTIVF